MNDHGYVVVSIAGHIVHAWGPADGRLFDTRAQAHSVIRRFRREDKARGTGVPPEPVLTLRTCKVMSVVDPPAVPDAGQ